MTIPIPEQLRRPWHLAALLPVYRLLRRYRPQWCTIPEKLEIDPHASAMLADHNWLYNLIFPPFFKKIRHEIASKEALAQAASGGTLVYVMRKRGQLEFNYFAQLFAELGLPAAKYANDISLCRWMRWPQLKATLLTQLEKMDKESGLIGAISSGRIVNLLTTNESALLSLSPVELQDAAVILSYSQKLIRATIEAQRKTDRPLYFVPLEFIWDRRPTKDQRSLIDILFGEKENPGRIRKMTLFWRNYRHRAVARIGRPINLLDEMNQKPKVANDVFARQAGGELLDALRLERRTITGPPIRSKGWFVERVLTDDAFQQTLCLLAARLKKPADDLQELSRRYITELAADINYTYIELGDMIMRWAFKSLYRGLVYNKEGLQNTKELYATTPIVFVPNHKSHFDYLILSYILHNNFMTIPHVAAGVNLSFWPLGAIIRRCGAYFIRRSFENNELYKACVETYLRVLLEEGYSQEFFIEGGRSRTGKLMPPKYGMVRMLVNGVAAGESKDVNFIPVSLTYDRVIEQKIYEQEVSGGAKIQEKPTQMLRLLKYLRRQKPRYGKIYVNFGRPISYREAAGHKNKEEIVPAIVSDLCHEINRNLVVTPEALVAAAILSHTERGTTYASLYERASLFLSYLRFKDANLSQSIFLDADKAIFTAVESLVSSKLIYRHEEAFEPFYAVDEDKRLELEYFKNGCAHFLASIGVLSLLLLKLHAKTPFLTIDSLVEDFSFCQKLLRYEFQFSTSHPVTEHIKKILEFLSAQNVISLDKGGHFKLKKGARDLLIPFSNLMRNFLESILIALMSIKREYLKKTDEKDLIKGMLQTGKNMLLLGHVQYREAISKVNFANCLRLFCDIGILTDHSDKLGAKGKKIFSSTDNKELIRDLQVKLEKLM